MRQEAPVIALATFNARYIHAAFGLRCLLANMGDLRGRTALLEFDLKTSVAEAAERLLALRPVILGLGVYIWNAAVSLDLVRLLKTIRPGLRIVLGGPEVSHETDRQEICGLADHIVLNDGDLAFPDLCRRLLAGETPQRVIDGGAPPMGDMRPAYDEYTDEDLAHRILYVEASRGCPFRCEFCLSSLDIPVRQADPAQFLGQMERLLDRGARQFKFVDRTFNLDLRFARAILDFFLDRWRPGLFLHFEMVPDRLPEALREPLKRFPPGSVQLEVGIQTFNKEVAERIRRRQNYERTEENLRWLRAETGAHIHADLIAGLPGESLESFAAGFDRLAALRPQEIQVGILKRLRGTPIARHAEQFGMIFNPAPPYDLIESNDLDYVTVRKLNRFSMFWDRLANSGRFPNAMRLLLESGPSAFGLFWDFSIRLHERFGRAHSIAADDLARALFEELVRHRGLQPERAEEALLGGLRSAGRRDTHGFLKPAEASAAQKPAAGASRHGARQRRHLARPLAPS